MYFTGGNLRGGRRIGFIAAAVTCAQLLLLLLAAPARATDVIVVGGHELTLSADVTLADGDAFSAGDESGARCAIHGGGHVIASAAGWTGSFVIKNCDVDGLGASGGLAIDVVVVGAGTATVQGSTFSTSSQIQIGAQDQATVYFQRNTIATDSVVSATVLLADSQPAISFRGNSQGTKLFQGNHVLKSRVAFGSMTGWLIGGDTPAEGNVIAGTRAGIDLARVDSTQVRNNYIHTTIESSGWNQVKNLTVSEGFDLVIEHNILWGYNWLVELNGSAELRYNLLLNNIERGWVLVWARVGARVHHNLAISTKENSGAFPTGGFVVEDGSDTTIPHDLEIFNNTFDGAGKCTEAMSGVIVMHGAYVNSLRSNAFVGVRVLSTLGAALVHGNEDAVTAPLPSGLGYTDYNLFYNPDSPVKVNYSTGVQGKTMRVDTGFAGHDLNAGGAANQQVDPKFALDPMIRALAFDETSVLAGATTVCQILAFYRHAYSPGPSSPLIHNGDPADGPDNWIGAIGTSTGDPADLFGNPNLAPSAFTCAEVPLDPGTTGAGGSGVLNHGFTCVCSLDPASPGSNAAALAVGGLILAVAHARPSRARRRRRRASGS